MTETYLSLKQAAARSGLAYAGLRREIEKGNLSACRVGRKYFVAASSLAAWQQGRRAAPADGYSVRQVMEILPLSYAFVIELIRSGRLPAVKRGRQYIVSREDLERFINEASSARP